MTTPAFPAFPTQPNDITQLPSKPTSGPATTGSQRHRRFTDTFFDGHKHPVKFPNGRPWTGEREFTSGTDRESITAGFITSDLQQGQYFCDDPGQGQTQQERHDTLTSTWSCPWIPLAKYFRFNMRQKRIAFAYDLMIANEEEGLAAYWLAAAKMAGENDVIDPERPDAVPFRIKVALGSPRSYTGKIRLARAAQAGDPWLLGFVEEPNVELAKIIGFKVNFIGGRAGDSQYTSHALPPEPKPLVTPEQVNSVPLAEVQKMIADALAQHEAQKAEANRAKGAALRAAKDAKKGKKPVAA